MTPEERQTIKNKKEALALQKKEFSKKAKNLLKKEFLTSQKYELDTIKEDGKAHINVDLTKVESPFSIYSYEKRLDSEIYSYIEDQVNYLKAEIPVVINFDDGGKYSDDLKQKIRKCVVRHYSLEYEDKKLAHFKRILFGISLLAVGALILLTYILLSINVFKDNNIYIEIVCILSWVFVWQGVDALFISGHYNRIDVFNAAQLALAEITFEKF